MFEVFLFVLCLKITYLCRVFTNLIHKKFGAKCLYKAVSPYQNGVDKSFAPKYLIFYLLCSSTYKLSWLVFEINAYPSFS